MTGKLRWAMCLFVVSGCSTKPRAPALQDETVYQNSQEGFRFLPPADWKQQARAEFPAGPVTEKRLLVEYKCFYSEQLASLDVAMLDVAEERTLADCLREHGSEGGWQPAAPVEELRVGGRQAVRGAFALRVGPEQTVREVVAVRRGSRVYFFTGVFTPGDVRSRDAIRQAVATVSW